MTIQLRALQDSDLPVFFAFEREQGAGALAGFVPRPEPEFMAHWQRIRHNPDNIIRTITQGGEVAGYVSSFLQDGEREVAFWIGQRFWGQGVATAALTAFLPLIHARPLHARVVEHNLGSRRVLEKCGFQQLSTEAAPDGLVEVQLRLD